MLIPRFSIQSILLLTAGVATAAALGRTLHAPVTSYRAECTIEIEPTLVGNRVTDSHEAHTVRAFHSAPVLQSVVNRRPDAAAPEFTGRRDATTHLARKLEVRFDEHPHVYRVAYQGGNADVASEVVDVVIEEFASRHATAVTRHATLIRAVSN
jgi:hypothetical protein